MGMTSLNLWECISGLPFPCGGTRQLLKLLGRYKHGPVFFKENGLECENIWHGSQVTFLYIVLLCVCMGDPHPIKAPGKTVGKNEGQGGVAPDSNAHTAPHFYETRGSSNCFPRASLRSKPVVEVFQIAASVVSFTKNAYFD